MGAHTAQTYSPQNHLYPEEKRKKKGGGGRKNLKLPVSEEWLKKS